MARKPKAPPKTPPPDEPHMIGYARVSMADQDPQMQIDALVKAGVDPRDIYWEKASGSTTDKRREFGAMMKDVQEHDIVVVWKLDRLGRNARQLYETAEAITAKGANLRIITSPGLDTTHPMGRAMFGMLAVFAEFEREMIRERTVAGLARARAEGRKGGRTALAKNEAILAAEKLGPTRAAKKLGYKSLSGYLKALARAKAAQMETEGK